MHTPHLYEREKKHAEARGEVYPERDSLEIFLTKLANRMQAGQTTVLKVETVADKTLLQAALDATILTQDSDDLRFSHQLLQEYFAARTLLEKMMSNADPRPVFGDTWWNVTVWRETMNMLIDFSKEPLQVMRWIAPVSLPLVEEIASTHDIMITELGEDFLLSIANEQKEAKNPIGRAAAYRVLGLFDTDNRPYIGVKDGLPDIDWVTIPDDGEWTYQEDKHLGLGGYDISKYPITYVQFQSFVDASDGLNSREHDWFEGLSADENDKQLLEQSFKYSNHPRETVNWYQAMAFCRWLSWKLRPNNFEMMKVETWAVRLPTEFEWEKAARGTDGREYPYEGDFDASKGNTRETGIGKTSAVGIFPQGASPYGVLDMSGNVWEWCLSEHSKPAEHLSKENISSFSYRVLRGGSWSYNSYNARAAVRFNFNPYDRYDFVGFRVLRPPSL